MSRSENLKSKHFKQQEKKERRGKRVDNKNLGNAGLPS
jgi:hypothetical protein